MGSNWRAKKNIESVVWILVGLDLDIEVVDLDRANDKTNGSWPRLLCTDVVTL